MKRLFYGIGMFVVLLASLQAVSMAGTEVHWGTRGWLQFPSNDFSPAHDPGIEYTSSARLALTAEGPEIAMSYTPAAYALEALQGQEMMELQFFDAPLSPGLPFEQGQGAVMELIFEDQGYDDWSVECQNSSGNYQVVANSGQTRFAVDDGPCAFPSGQWSPSLRVFPGRNSFLIMRTVWLGSQAEADYYDQPAGYEDIVNVFRLQSRHGIVRLAATNPADLRNVDGNSTSFFEQSEKAPYQRSINWAVLYKTEMKTFFSFEIDVSQLNSNYLLLWDKDADANRLFTNKGKAAAKPPDDGIKMLVRWSDGSPLEYIEATDELQGGIPITENPEWTHFDQTNRAGFQPDWHVEGETNQYDGPSWDTDKDPNGVDSLRWYRIPLHERKSDTILVGWYGSTMPQNTFAFAASAPVTPAPCGDLSACRELFEIPAVDEPQICPESDHEDCKTFIRDDLRLTIDAIPAPETDQLNEKGIEQLQYILSIENISEVDVSDLFLHLEAPKGTHFTTPRLDEYFSLAAGVSTRSTVDVTLTDTGKSLEMITSAGAFSVDSPRGQQEFAAIQHYPGNVAQEEVVVSCLEEGLVRLCVDSTPLAHPSPESYGLDPRKTDKNVITYHFDVTNLSEDLELEQLVLQLTPPLHTSLHPDYWNTVSSSAGGQYTGKGEASLGVSDSLSPGDTTSFSLSVQLDTLSDQSDYDVSSKDRFHLRAKNHSSVVAPELVHHVGKGAVQIEVHRCYAFDYFGGDFSCSDMCQVVEPGTKITVRDRLQNLGSSASSEYSYLPLPLSSAFLYQEHSLKIDDPETGLELGNESAFPQEPLIIPRTIPSQGYRDLFFTYFVPEDVLDEASTPCFTVEEPVHEDPGAPELIYENACEASSSEQQEGSICVGVEDDPRLEAQLTSLPGEDSTVYQGSTVQYFLNIMNHTRQPVEELEIEAVIPQQTECTQGLCNLVSDSKPPSLGQKYGQLQLSVTVQVNSDAQGSVLRHPGYVIRYRGADGDFITLQTEGISHPLIAAPEPTGDFQHDIRLNRRTALNAADRNTPRQDQADRIEISHRFEYEGRHKSFTWPQMSGSRHYRYNVCNAQFPSYEPYDATFNASTIAYNSLFRYQQLTSFDQLRSGDVTFHIVTNLPQGRPEFILDGMSPSQHHFTYTLSGTDRSNRGINPFMKEGGVRESPTLVKTPPRAVKDGVAGEVETTNWAESLLGREKVSEDYWSYQQTSFRIDPVRCTSCTNYGCYRYPAYVPIYRWVMTHSVEIPLVSTDRDYVTALTSVAWLQTKNGHMGFGSPLWETDPVTGDPNWVNLGDTAVPSLMKWYSPPGESNADLYILHTGDHDPLESGLGGSGRVKNDESEGFIHSPLEDQGRQLSRAQMYDRDENPRDYLDDLLNRQLYGRVIRLNNAQLLPPGMTRNGNTFSIRGPLSLENDTIYHLKGLLQVGQVGISSIQLVSGRARIIVDGDVEILSNVRYAKHDADDLSKVTSIRVHSLGNIQVHPAVTDIELMMLAEGRFASGKGDKQLRILGDVIAHTVAWERRPLNNARELDEEVNKPSEIIYEDFRKYLVPPPGDEKLSE